MFRKELEDTAKSSSLILLFSVITIGFSFLVLRQVFGFEVAFRDFLLSFSWFGMLVVAFSLGGGVFSKEKAGKVFEYFYSLPVSRWRLLVYKISPPALALFIFMILYFFFNSVIFHSTQPMDPWTFVVMLVLIFLFSASMSLMYKNDIMTFVSNLFVFILIFTIYTLTVLSVNYSRYLPPRPATLFVIPFGIISLALFCGFIIRFRKFDMNNMPFLSRINLFHVMLPVMGLFLLFLVINQVDSGKPPAPTAQKDLAPVRYDKSNGYYRLWTLVEPPGTDIQSDDVITRYRRLFDPAYDNDKYIGLWNRYHYMEKFKEYFDKISLGINFSKPVQFDLKRMVSLSEAELKAVRQECSFLLDRYRQLIDSPVIEDITLPRMDAPKFNHLVWLRTAKLYLVVNAMDAVNGQWEQGVGNILSHIDFARRVANGSRVLITDLVAKGAASLSFDLLASLMNRDDCPEDVFKQILAGLPPLKPGEFSIDNDLVFEYLQFVHYIETGIDDEIKKKSGAHAFLHIGRSLFLQKNRTAGYANRVIKKIKQLEDTPPYQWEFNFADLRESVTIRTEGACWWLFNPVGKILYNSYVMNGLGVIVRTYKTRALYDLTRISAELHLRDNPALPVEEVLKRLDTYKTIDPCSGKPYKWNPQKGVLYGIGTDRTDNDGTTDWKLSDIDFILPIRLRGRK